MLKQENTIMHWTLLSAINKSNNTIQGSHFSQFQYMNLDLRKAESYGEIKEHNFL
jgi:hypothetical protein